MILIIGTVLVTSGLATIPSIQRELNSFNTFHKDQLRETAIILSKSVAGAVENNDRASTQAMLTSISRLDNIIHVDVKDPSGKVLSEMGQGVIMPARNMDIQQNTTIFKLINARSMSATVPIIRSGNNIGTLTIYQDISGAHAAFWNIITTSVVTTFLASFFGIIAAFLLQQKILKPVRTLTAKMQEIRNSDNYTVRAEICSDDEVGQMADTFNNMLDNINIRDKKLELHRQTLESTVEKRTRQFKKARDHAIKANAAKSNFLATMSHEIRTPMNGIMVMAELLSAANLTSRHKRYANVIVNSGNSLLSIINDILDLSKIEAGKMQLENIEHDPATVIGDVINLFSEKASSAGLSLSARLHPSVPRKLIGDPVRLNQIISNLVNNAIKFTKNGGVTIVVTYIKGTLSVQVNDTGIGIADDKKQKIFDSFSQADQSTTREFGGTGLGLSICKKLVTAMNGQIGVRDGAFGGSCFYFTIDTKMAAAPIKISSLSGVSILVLIDNSLQSETLTQSIRDYGAEPYQTIDSHPNPQYIIATPARLKKLPPSIASTGRICLASIGDLEPEHLVSTGQAQDILFDPILPKDLQILLQRISHGKLRGKNALRDDSPTGKEYTKFTGKKILIADDSAVNREVIIEAMRTLSAQAVTVTNGLEAVEAVKSGSFDMVFMDCSMPVMDGYEATRRIRNFQTYSEGFRLPIVALTAQMAGTKDTLWREAGMDAFLTKPFTLETLASVMTTFLCSQEEHDNDSQALPPPLSEPVISTDIIANLRQMGQASEVDLAAKAITLFAQNSPAALSRIANAIKANEMEELAHAAHALKSMSYNVGALKLGKACENIEESSVSAKTVQPENIKEMVTSFQETSIELKKQFPKAVRACN